MKETTSPKLTLSVRRKRINVRTNVSTGQIPPPKKTDKCTPVSYTG